MVTIKIFSVFGISGSGKTTTIENIIKELKKRRYSIGSIKEIHFEDFAIDTEGSNTDRHRKAGSELITARGYYETDLLYPEKLPLAEILKNYHQDYVILEGIADGNFPKIIAAHDVEEIEERLDKSVIAVSGKIANEINKYKGLPVINSINKADKLVDLIEEKVYEKLPDFPPECCSACGYTCSQLGIRILEGRSKREDCVISDNNVKLNIDGQKIDMVPFVQKLLRNAVTGVVRELEGYKPGSKIEIKLGGFNENR